MPQCCNLHILEKLFHLGLIIAVAMLPLTPISSLAATKTESEATLVLTEQSKIPVVTTESKTEIHPETTAGIETSAEAETSQNKPQTTQVEADQPMSTGMKVAIGVGAGVVVIAGIAALAGGGSGDSAPTPPTADEVAGAWHANAICVDGRTYSGTYTLYAGGSHYFDVTISDGTHIAGSGAWKLNEYDLELQNYQHSTYRGTFEKRIKTTVTLYATSGRWKLVLSK